ncbi:ACT domain-containing protein [Lewinella sp. JB7]|uniref:ACT domain-containing protein n=1 Tax=Lewinella sp. JB7 TaxID=2962887 RepID=UPI0020C9BB48|nr:ACT domain-containing protein [Lewinella sp. JB7]MCP9237103.1 ACT domain-containing protein [Lewinella sp. JB7]
MAGEKDLTTLLRGLSPVLHEGQYVFASVSDRSTIDRTLTIGEFREREGTTVIVERSVADRLGLPYDYVAAWITLEVHSALAAVGLTAAVAGKLAEHSISCNVVAGYYHDHIFVNWIDRDSALRALTNLAREGI